MFPYIGGKAHHVSWMEPLFPSKFSRYVEVFGGAGWVMVKSNKIQDAEQRIYNDRNPYLANVWECFRTDPNKLLEIMNEIPKSDVELYRAYQHQLFSQPYYWFGKPDYPVAAQFLYLQTQVFAGTPLSINNVPYFTDKTGKYSSKWDTLRRKLEKKQIQDTIKSITVVENMDCEDVIQKWDDKDTFFYIDPPYYNTEFYYSETFSKEKHHRLADLLRNIQGKFALSYYDFDNLKDMYPPNKFNWHRQEVYRAASTRSSNKKDYNRTSKGTEVLIMNYQTIENNK